MGGVRAWWSPIAEGCFSGLTTGQYRWQLVELRLAVRGRGSVRHPRQRGRGAAGQEIW